MNLTWHIAKKDLRRFWVPLTLLSAVTAIRFGMGISLLTANDPEPEWFDHMGIYANVLWGIGLFLTYMLAAAVVQEDSVASPAFWQTRPISGPRLLAAKTIGLILMFGILPVLLSIPWWLGCGFGCSEICHAGAETLAVQAIVVLLALPWSVVTGQYDRFLLWTFVAAVASITDATLLIAGHGMASQQELFTGAWAGPTKVLVIGLLAVAGGLFTAIHQFVTRKTWRSVVVIVVTALSMAAAGRWWTWEASAIWALKPVAPAGLAKDIKISLDYAYVWQATNGSGVGEVNLIGESVPSPYVLSPLYSEQNLRWADGSLSTEKQFDVWRSRTPSYANNAFYLMRLVPQPNDRNWVQYVMRHNLVPFSRMYPQWGGRFFEPFTAYFSPESMRRLASQRPIYDGTFWFHLFKPDVIGETDIHVGAALSKGTIRSRVSAISNDPKTWTLLVSFVDSSPESLWTDFLEMSQLTAPRAQPIYCIVNRSRTYARGSFNETRYHTVISNVAIALRKEAFQEPNHWNALSRKWEKERDGLVGATVAEVNFEEVERFSLPIAIDKFDFRTGIVNSQGPSPKGTYAVAGQVEKPGDFHFSRGTTLVNALRAAGGVTDEADLSKVALTRIAADGTASTVLVNVEAWLEDTTPSESAIPVLQPGDVVLVPSIEAGQTFPP